MTGKQTQFIIWIHQASQIASFHPVVGFEMIRFPNRDSFLARVRILVQAGFRFQ